MMNILDRIVIQKQKEVEENKSLYPIKLLEKSIYFPTQPVSLRKYIKRKDKSGIIAEIKRKSPSKGVINAHVSIEKTSIGYVQAGASALSILTDTTFFGGKNEDLTIARKFNFCPILRKEFILDEYQIIEAKSIGADAILLIASILEPDVIKSFIELAHSLQLEVLLEIHEEEELNMNSSVLPDLIGVNNRNLKFFDVDLEVSKKLSDKIDKRMTKVSESGIDTPEQIIELRQYGFEGFLMGEKFMKHDRPEEKANEFIKGLSKVCKQSGGHVKG